MEYITANEAAEKWGISSRRVHTLCAEGRVDGAARLGNAWAIPKDAKKPKDARVKNGKYIKIVDDMSPTQKGGDKIETIDQYIFEQPVDVQPVLQRIREVIREAAPEAAERISWRMPTFWQGQNLIHFAAFKKHIGIYPGGEATAVFAARLTGYKTAKGTIQLPLDKPIPYDLIAEIARWRVADATRSATISTNAT